MRHAVTLLAGEAGEATTHIDHVVRTIDATGAPIDWHRHTLNDHQLPQALIDDVRATRVMFMPFMQGLRDQGKPAPIVQARREFGVFANLRPSKSLPGVGGRFDGVDLVVIRETTEDIYTSLEHESIKGMFEGLKVTTRAACERIARHAFEYARESGRKKVTVVHKSNIMKKSDGLFLATARDVAKDFPDIAVEDRIVDALCMQLTMWPEDFDILLCANLFGDIVADVGAGLVGGLANTPSVNVGEDGIQIYTVGHGEDLARYNSEAGNPTSLLISAEIMLRGLGENAAADRLEKALRSCLADGKQPLSVGGKLPLATFCDAVIDAMKNS